jgi:hypothetical protein
VDFTFVIFTFSIAAYEWIRREGDWKQGNGYRKGTWNESHDVTGVSPFLRQFAS